MRALQLFALTLMIVIVGVGIVSLIKWTSPKEIVGSALCEHLYRFRPQPSITAYQLATILTHMSGPMSWNAICVSDDKPIGADLIDQFERIK